MTEPVYAVTRSSLKAATDEALSAVDDEWTVDEFIDLILAALPITDEQYIFRAGELAERARIAAAVKMAPNPYDEGSEATSEAMLAIGFEKGRAAVLAIVGESSDDR